MYVDENKTVTRRKTMNILDMLSKVGGLFAGLKSGMFIFVSMFSLSHINTQFANRLYTWMKPDSFCEPEKDE